MESVKLEELDLKSLKALFYDFMVEKETIEKNIQVVNQEIATRLKAEIEQQKKHGGCPIDNEGEKSIPLSGHIPASNHNSLVNSTEGNQLIT